MAQENGSPFKLVFSDWWISRKYLGVARFKFPMPNGLHPAFVQKAKEILSDEKLNNPILLEKSMMRTTTLAETFQKKDAVTGFDNGNFFRHGNFLGYWHKCNFINQDRLNYEFIVSPEDIDVNDNITYYYPIEVECDGLRLISDDVTITVNGENHRYKLPETWSPKLLELFRAGKVKILIINIVDATGPLMYITRFEDMLVEYGINPQNLVWLQGDVPNYYFSPERNHKSVMLSGCLSARQAYENYIRYPVDTGYTPDIRITSDIMRESDLNPKVIRKYKFLSFNRSMDRPHRVANQYMVLKHGLLNEGIFSFLNHRNKHHIIDHLRQIFPNESEELLLEYSQKIADMLPYEIDTQILTMEQKESFQNIDVNPKHVYADTYLNIVTETNGWDEIDAFWSEKIWRPILNLQPFIFIGPYNSLNRLHKLGFKTFHPFIDESYDRERDMTIRIKMIEEQIVKFKNLSIKEIHDWYYSISDILVHNQKNIESFKNWNPLQELWKL